jgi:hypothetical protein
MADPIEWQQTFKKISEFRTRLSKLPPEERTGEALIEIASQLIELNQGLADLTEAVHAVANAP